MLNIDGTLEGSVGSVVVSEIGRAKPVRHWQRLHVRARQPHAERRSFVHHTLNLHRPAMGLDDGLDDREAEAETARIVRDACQNRSNRCGICSGGMPGPGVTNASVHPVCAHFEADLDLSTIRGELHGVGDEIRERLRQPIAIADNRRS